MAIFFVSDVHLSPERAQVTSAFYEFLSSHARKATDLFILGDLFETWIGDDDPSDLAVTTQIRLKELTLSGTKLFVQHGNRDFLLGRRFMNKTGAVLIRDYHVIEAYNQRILVTHGDLLCSDDLAYQSFRRKTRNPIYRWILSHLPLSKRQEMASRWRAEATRQSSSKPSTIMDVSRTTVQRVMSTTNTVKLIHGHTHMPARHKLSVGDKERIVLGDWESSGWAVRLDHKGIELFDFGI
tara:strand:+ start:95 stop:811 length:717 start_codon:yes stop_codon:yes gene_type:complete